MLSTIMKGRVKTTPNEQPSKSGDENQMNTKKPFDKKKYRAQKYSNKYKINQWDERRKKAILRDYYKELDKSQRGDSKQTVSLKIGDQNENGQQPETRKMSAFHKAKREFLRKKDEKRKKKEEALRVKSEKDEALNKYKEKRMQTYKRLSKKTRKGQPLMKDRMEMLLEKIQQQVSN